MTDDPKIPADVSRMTFFDEYGNEDTVEIAGLTITLSNTLMPLPPRPKIGTMDGYVGVTGEITAYWTAPQLRTWMRAASAAMENRMLRVARPHMGKRQFQRLRGTLKASRRAMWGRASG